MTDTTKLVFDKETRRVGCAILVQAQKESA